MRPILARAAFVAAPLLVPSLALARQAAPTPQPTCVRGVTLGRAADGKRANLLLQQGRIAAVLDPAAPTPPGHRIVEGEGLFCLPAFLDADARSACPTPEPVKDQDVPLDTSADVGIDMRLANRKGIQPAFRAVEALSTKDSKSWREAGFGALLAAPGGQILAGSSALAVTRDAARRDVVLVPDVFAHAAFAAGGEGYPTTVMGYVAQFRQFLLDAGRHAELEQRYAEQRPGPRPPFDRELEAGVELLSGKRRLFCEADTQTDIERWIKLADEFGLSIGIVGGREAWRDARTLADRGIPVVLTLDFGPEPKDPAKAAKKPEEAKKLEAGEAKPAETPPGEAKPAETPPGEAKPAETPPGEAAAVPSGEKPPEPAAGAPAEEPKFVREYEEPLGVRRERRRLWEEGRGAAKLLREAGVPFAFGTASEKPAKLLDKVRGLVKEAGLSADDALAALTTDAAELLGVAGRLGRIEPGYDATFTLWSADPLTDEKARTRWIFVDGFPTEFPKEEPAAKPAEGLDVSGAWTLEIQAPQGPRQGDLTLKMEKDGTTTGTLVTENPIDQSELTVELTGRLSEKRLELEGKVDLGPIEGELELALDVEGDALSGKTTVTVAGQEPESMEVTGKRVPKSASARGEG